MGQQLCRCKEPFPSRLAPRAPRAKGTLPQGPVKTWVTLLPPLRLCRLLLNAAWGFRLVTPSARPACLESNPPFSASLTAGSARRASNRMFPDLGAPAQRSAQACNPEFGRAALYSPHGGRARWGGAGRLCSQLITEQADISLTRGAEVKGRCGHNESELQVFWVDRAYALKMLFVKVTPSGARGGGVASGWVWAGAFPRFPHPEAAGGEWRAPPPLGRKVTTRLRAPRRRGGWARSSLSTTPRRRPILKTQSVVSRGLRAGVGAWETAATARAQRWRNSEIRWNPILAPHSQATSALGFLAKVEEAGTPVRPLDLRPCRCARNPGPKDHPSSRHP